MPLIRLLLLFVPLVVLSARSLPVRRFEANLIPLDITADQQGILWMTTGTGVVRFDGLHFEPVQAPPGIDLASAHHIATGPDGSIWIGTAKGLLRYREGAFTTELQGEITALYVTRAGRLLASVNPDEFVHVCAEPDRSPTRWVRLRVTALGRYQEDLAGTVWFSCGRRICSWSDADVQSAAAGTHWRLLPSISILSVAWGDIVALPDHSLWGRNGPDVVKLVNGIQTSQTPIPVETFQGVRPGFLLDRRGRLWIPGRKLHVVEDGVLRVADGVPLDDVISIYQDARHTLWFGLAGKGLAAVPDETSLETWSETEGIAGSVLDLAIHPQLGLLAATDTGAYVFHEREGRWQALNPSGERTVLRSLAVGANGEVLFLPHGRGLTSSTRRFTLPPGLDEPQFRKLYADRQGAIWICTLPGLFKLNPEGRVVPVPLPHGVYPSDVQSDPAGHVWVGYEGGIAQCAGETCTPAISPKDGLLDRRIRTIAPAGSDVWVGYRRTDAFTRFHRQQGHWIATHYKSDNGYGPEDTHFLRRDRRGWIWRGSTDGVYVCDGIHTEPEDWLHLTFGDRVNASYANMYGFLEQPDGSIWIGTQKGVVRVHPDEAWFKLAPPALLSVPSVRAPHDQEFHLSQPGLPVFQSRRFRYRLLPSDSKWRVSTSGIVHYARLQPGTYRFQVAAGGGRAPLEKQVIIPGNSLFRTRLWIALGVALVLALAISFVWYARRRRMRRQVQQYWAEKRAFLEARGPEEMQDWSGRTLDGRFVLEERIATGGFASVYRARDAAAGDEQVAVKLLHPIEDDEQWRRRRFAAEVASLRKLDHPGIVRIQHTGDAAPGQPYLVMEFLDGITLRALLAGGPLEFDRAARLLQQIGEALSAAHRAEILHRDLKPENIMVCEPGKPQEHIKLIDFGIARAQTEPNTRHTTRLAGSPGYLAPERWVGMETPASDIYAMAAIAWEMLTGECYQHGTPPPPALPQPVADVLTAALSYDPQQRPQEAETLMRELRAQMARAAM